jgi:beta-D-xylosidase 4
MPIKIEHSKTDWENSNSTGAERIGLPPYEWWSEGLHGVAASPGVTFNRTGSPFSYATSFANAITIAAAFDDDLVHEIATVISTEARAFINAGFAGLDFWTPNINPYKDPRWGRGSEVRLSVNFSFTKRIGVYQAIR